MDLGSLPAPRRDPGTPAPSPALAPGPSLAPTMALGAGTAALDPVLDRTADVLAAGHTAERGAATATAGHPCPTAAGILATGPIRIPTPAWGCSA